MDFKIKPMHILAIVVVIIVLIGVVYVVASDASSPTVAVGDNVSVFYTGTLTNGTVFDTNVGNEPLNFTVGSGEVIEGFDDAVLGMKLNEKKTVTIPANEAYGPVNPDLIMSIPKDKFANQSIEIGMTVGGTVSGQQVEGTVTAVNATNVTVDFNPQLAGQTLIFNITVVKISKGSSQ